jgi:chromosome segregation ATPase
VAELPHEYVELMTPDTRWWQLWMRKSEVRHQLKCLWEYSISQTEATNVALERMEERMSQLDDALSALDDATNAVAARLDALAAQVANSDQAAADRINAEADKLRALAADPNQPVPDPSVNDAPPADDSGDAA